MADPAQKSVDGPAQNDLAELRRLLVGAEIERLARLEASVSDPSRFERAFSRAAHKDPRALADAVFPVIGPAIRQSIAAALREFAETLSQVAEKSLSLRGIRWRLESLLSGKPFGEILLARSLLYSVEQVFLIQRDSGLLLKHAAAKGTVVRDADMVSGMLTAIQNFVSDSFADPGHDLETIDAGRFRLWITYAPKVILVGVVSGTPPGGLKDVLRHALDTIRERLQDHTDNFELTDSDAYEDAYPVLQECLLGQPPGRRKKIRVWPLVAAGSIMILAPVARLLYTEAQWSRYFEALKQQPGIVVTAIEKRGSQWVVAGLRDPYAPDPTALLSAHHLEPSGIRFAWQPYLSLNTPFAAQRELQAAIDRVRKQIIHFDNNVSRLTISAADRIDDLTEAIAALSRLRPEARITVIGHADEAATPVLNQKLSLDRAREVLDALAAQGVDRGTLATSGVGASTPLRTGGRGWDRRANRSVTFEVAIP